MKINLPLFQLLKKIQRILEEYHSEGYLVGGSIRDILLNKTPSDIDILVTKNGRKIVTALAEKLKAPSFPLKEKFKIYRIVHADFTLDFSQLTESSVEENLGQRDFTLNSIAYPLVHLSPVLLVNRLIDPFQGMHAIKDKVIQHTSDTIFADDPVRLLRAFRLQLQLRCSIHPATLTLLSHNAHLITHSAAERIMAEFIKIISCKNSCNTIRQIDSTNLLEAILPEINESKGCIQLGYHDFDVWEHSLLSYSKLEILFNSLKEMFPQQLTQLQKYLNTPLSGTINKKTALKFACLLHDIGKPQTRTLHKDGKRYSFINHQKNGAEMARIICKRIKLDNKSTAFISFVIEHHLICGHYYTHSLITPRYLNRLFLRYEQDTIALGFIFLADLLSQKSFTDPCPSLAFLAHLLHHYYHEFKPAKRMKPLLDGNDIMKKYHLAPGPRIGKILSVIQEAQINGLVKTKRDCYKLIELKFPRLDDRISSH